MSSIKSLLALTVSFLFLLMFTSYAMAIEVDGINLPEEKTLPGSGGYPLKRLGEKLKPLFIFNKKAKAEYKCHLVEKRLSELAQIVEKKDTTVIETSAQRYAAQAGTCDLEILKTKKDQHKKVLAVLRDNFKANTTYWLITQQDIDTLDILTR